MGKTSAGIDESASEAQVLRMRAMLPAWEGIEAGSDFEADVWRRLARDRTAALAPLSPAWAAALVLATMLAGAGLGRRFGAVPERHRAEDLLLHPRTLAGAYVAATTGGAP